MKIKSLTIKNIGLISDAAIELNQPLILFYGDIQAGKSTYLNAVRWCFGGAFPDDIIRHGAEEASIILTLDNGSISREWYRAKDGSTKSRPIVFVQDGKAVLRPVDEIEKFLNPFLLDQDFLARKSESARKKYFSELFAVDTAALDAESAKAAAEAQTLRAKLSGFGEFDLTPVALVTVAELIQQRSDIRAQSLQVMAEVAEQNAAIRRLQAEREKMESILSSNVSQVLEARRQIEALQANIEIYTKQISDTNAWLEGHPKRTEALLPAPAATTELDAAIEAATANNVRYQQYEINLSRAAEKAAVGKRIRELEIIQSGIQADKIFRLKSISETCGIPGLVFDETGDFFYQGVSAGMLSTSQIMELSAALSARYPKGFGLDLIDRGESLGTSIFKFVERAKAEDKTILATIVGERPASVPEHVGVFVVTKGAAIP
jgi:hypothetical protein